MLLYLFDYLAQFEPGFKVFHFMSALTALIVSFLVGPTMIRRLSNKNIGQSVRECGPESHYEKAITFSTLLWGDLGNSYVWVALLVTMAYGVVGFIDDYKKVKLGNSDGLSARAKYFWQSMIALTAAIFLFETAQVPTETQFIVPFFKEIVLNMGWIYVVLTYFVIVGTSNAVNLTDGLDGLAIMPTVMVAGALAIFAYLTGNVKFAEYLSIPYIPKAGELTIFCGALVGAGLGFLWFNAYPAMVFMGDVGALALGAALGVVAVLVRQEIVLMIMGGVFVMETLSVIMQVASFKLTGKRIFKMAPIHHHFELKGWPEPHVIVRFWIITVILVLVGLSTLKLR